jgi:hypothetical protein
MVAAAVEHYRTLYDTVRPHEAIGFRTPLAVWRDFDRPPSPIYLRRKVLSFLTRDKTRTLPLFDLRSRASVDGL